MSARVKQVKSGIINVGTLIRKERLELETASLEEVLKSGTGVKEGSGYRWVSGAFVHPYIEGIKRRCRAAFGFGNEVKDFNVTIFPPPSPSPNSKNVNILYPTGIDIASRIVTVAGSRECIEFGASHGGERGTGKTSLLNGEALATNFGVCAGVSMMFSDRLYEKLPPARGGMEVTIKKNLASRYVVVIDAIMSTERLIEQITEQATILGKGDAEKTQSVKDAMLKTFIPQIDATSVQTELQNAEVVPTSGSE